MNETITAHGAPEALGPYCHAKRSGNTLYLSGQLGLDPKTGALSPGGIEAQVRQGLLNLGIVLQSAGLSYRDVVKTTIYLTNIDDFAAMNDVYASIFPSDPPARTCIQVAALPKGGLFEIDAIAVRG